VAGAIEASPEAATGGSYYICVCERQGPRAAFTTTRADPFIIINFGLKNMAETYYLRLRRRGLELPTTGEPDIFDFELSLHAWLTTPRNLLARKGHMPGSVLSQRRQDTR
jgi:hypothetical protein